ncbi:MAG: anti-sigma factor antagonist [Mycobacterium sp.]|nr:anti-sigma factor antagonist [Mycobacterium sp.]
MTVTGDRAPTPTSRYGNPAIDCNGAELRGRCRHQITTVTVTGDIHAMNVKLIGQHTKRLILPESSFVLDLAGVESFCARGVSLLHLVDEECRAAAVEWRLVASPAVVERLSTGQDRAAFPTAASVPEALGHFADNTLARRRLLPLLTKTA